jgi:hypothetical protein
MLELVNDDKTVATISKDGGFLAERGNSELQKIWDNTQVAINKLDHLNAVWTRSNTAWSVEHLTLTANGSSPWKKLKQIAAELEQRRAALCHAKYALLRSDVEIDKSRQLVQTTDDVFEKRLHALDIMEKEEQLPHMLRKIEGAMREVIDLERNYDELATELGTEITVDSINAGEIEAHLDRALRQSIRSVRHSGRIDPGNQEYLEQIGVNPTFAYNHISNYISLEHDTVDTKQLDRFVNSFIDQFKSVTSVDVGRMG